MSSSSIQELRTSLEAAQQIRRDTGQICDLLDQKLQRARNAVLTRNGREALTDARALLRGLRTNLDAIAEANCEEAAAALRVAEMEDR